MEETKIGSGINFPSLSSRIFCPQSERLKLSVWNYFLVIDLDGDDTTTLKKQIRAAIQFFKGINHGFHKKEAEFHEVAPEKELLRKDNMTLRWTVYLRLQCSLDLLQAVRESLSQTQHLFDHSGSEIACQHKLSPSIYVFNVIDRSDQLPEFPKISIPGSVLYHDGYKELFRHYNDEYGIHFRDDSGSRARHVGANTIKENGEVFDPVVYQQWKEYIDQLKLNSKPHDGYDPMKIMFGTLIAVTGQVVGGLAANRLSRSSTAGSTWLALAVELAALLGLTVAVAGMILLGKRNVRHALSALMIKIGAMVIAAAIIFSMGLHLPQEIAWIVGPITFLIMAVVVGLAANRLTTRSTARSSWPVLVELATLLGLSVAMASMILRGKRKRRALLAPMIKIGAIVIAVAIILRPALTFWSHGKIEKNK